MPRFGWTKLAYLKLVLTVMVVLDRPSTWGAASRQAPGHRLFTGHDASRRRAIRRAGNPDTTTEMARRLECRAVMNCWTSPVSVRVLRR